MVNRGWLYGLMVFLAQTCNPYYSANSNPYEGEEQIVFEDTAVDAVEIPDEAFDLSEDIQIIEPPRRVQEAPPPPPPPPMPEDEKIFKIVESMPRFPGCEQKAIGKKELNKCAKEEMLKFVYKNLKYPKIAKENGVEGKVIVKFVVNKKGMIRNAQIIRDLGAGCGIEALRVVNTMPRWIPGTQRGNPVSVQYVLPVSFKLPGKEIVEEAPAPEPEVRKERDLPIFKVVEDMPRFQNAECELEPTKSKKKQCAEKEMLKFIYSNIKYPQTARENGVEGMVVLQFVVDRDGTVLNPEALRDPGGGLGAEAIRVANLMPKWIPGKQRGKPVKIRYTLPVRFKL